MNDENTQNLRTRIAQLEAELAEKNRMVARLERDSRAAEMTEAPIAVSEFEETLKRMVQRIAMILQAEKCVIMILDKESGEPSSRTSSYGMSDKELKLFRVPITQGIAGEVFRTGNPAIFHDALSDPRTIKENVALLHIRNGVAVPLVIEHRDVDNRLIDRRTVGILYAFNKRYGGEFIEEDVRLLDRMARNAAAVITNAQMFQEIIEEKEKLVHTIESLHAGLLLVSDSGKIMQMNARARQMFDIEEDPVNHHFESVIKHDKCNSILSNLLSESVTISEEEEAEKSPDEISILMGDEERFFQVQSAVVRGEDRQPIGYAIIFNDITEIRNVERMKTEFVSVVSHELRTPLTPIKGFIRTLLDDTSGYYDVETRREFYSIIDQQVDRLSRMINDLLNVSRIERNAGLQLNWELINLRQIAETVVNTQRAMTEKHKLVIDFNPESIELKADHDKIEQMLMNLVNNAIKYSPDGGTVTITARLESDGAVLVGVTDQGIGIPKEAQKKLFSRFYRVDNRDTRKVGGTGIGLFLVKHLVQAHHGRIWIESEPGMGSTFWFRIPLAPPEEGEAQVSTASLKD
ncbi:MAG: ATP-binding protein [Armatimonadetes bacterium]|nr:ATP-binding protein [Armatimonadota bacterium]